MAGSMNGIIIELRGNPSELRKELEKIETIAGNLNKKLENGGTQWSKLGSAAENFGSKIDKVGTMVSNLGTKLSNNVTSPMLKSLGNMLTTAGDLTQAFGTVTTGVGTLTSAIGLMKTGIGNATGAAADLAKGLEFAFSPTGAIIGLATTGISLLISKIKEEAEEEKKREEIAQNAINKIEEEQKAIEDFRNSINDDLQLELNYIDKSKELWKELQKITDENGKIKDGYEDRAKVITEELSRALETEITLTDNVIDNYKEIQKEIDNLILKKKGEAILKASEEKYNKAIVEKPKKEKELLDKKNQIKNQMDIVEDERKTVEKLASNMPVDERYPYEKSLQNEEDELERLQAEYNKIEKTLDGYIDDIEEYEYNYQLNLKATPEAYNEMEKNLTKQISASYKERLLMEQITFNIAKKRYEEAGEKYDEIEEQKTKKTMDESKKRLQNIVNELKEQTEIKMGVNQEISQNIKEGWKTLATDSFDIYNEEVSKLPIITQQKIEEITGVAVTKAPEIESVMEYLGKVGINALEMNEEFRSKALESLENYINGLSDTEKREVLNLIGVQNVEEVIKGLSEGNLSEEAGIKVLENFDKGLRNEAIQNMLKGSATTLANKLSGILTIQPMIKAGILGIQIAKGNIPGHKLGLDYVPYDNYIARLHKGERILTAKENEQLIKFEKMPKVIDNTSLINNQMRTMENKVICTTPNITFNVQKMDKANLDMAFNYINKRFGTQY